MVKVAWSKYYTPTWDEMPEAYVTYEVVAWGRSRRLGKAIDTSRDFKAYVGVQHYDPARWHVAGEATAKFFVSLFHRGRTVSLRTYPTLSEALAALEAFHASLAEKR